MDLLSIDKVFNDFPELMENYPVEAWDIKDKYFLNPDSIHGVLHAKRVLLLSYIIGLYEDLDDTDMEIVLTAAKYHDIGRTNDKYDEIHGILSFNKMLQLKLVDKEMEDINILRFIMESHCISDENGLKNLKKYSIKDTDRAICLYKVLKDADGLDRVRLHDMDISYLRLPTSKRLPFVAQQIFNNLK
jgi:HD superfamily phosphodiesterase